MVLLSDDALDRSGVVANCRMNRERTLTGSNGYTKQLGFNVLDVLLEQAAARKRWLDLCCGSGKALIQAAQVAHHRGMGDQVEIVGVDLVVPVAARDPGLTCLDLVEASLTRWKPAGQFDVITCVHGLHYIGDKLGLIARAASWLNDDGLFVANLDVHNIKMTGGHSAHRAVAGELRRIGLEYNGRKKLLRCSGRRSLHFPFRYLGADDQAGPNYTKQPAVDSYYEETDRHAV